MRPENKHSDRLWDGVEDAYERGLTPKELISQVAEAWYECVSNKYKGDIREIQDLLDKLNK